MWLQVIVSTLLLGGVFALLSIGLTLLFGVAREINFAQGDFVMVSMFIAWWLYESTEIDPYLSVFIITPLIAILGYFIYQFLIRPLSKAPESAIIFTTLGISIVLQNSMQIIFTANVRSLYLPYSVASIKIGYLLFSIPMVIALLVSLLFALTLYLFIRFTTLGKALSATAQDRTAAELMGIRVERMIGLTWALAVATAGVAGALLIPIQSVAPNVGLRFTLLAFVIVVLGGLGSVPGAIIGGFLVALVGGISSLLLDPSLSQAFYLLMFIIVLLIRPAGLFGMKGAEVYSHE